ncbi:hypothetical protein KCP69_22095 [Salmonella enterica subsp. enterica]|nr:hypothetical protein KCP69_22095 [Salmonella enterica subsp. enterica]
MALSCGHFEAISRCLPPVFRRIGVCLNSPELMRLSKLKLACAAQFLTDTPAGLNWQALVIAD